MERKRLFRIALAVAGLTAADFAGRHGVTGSAISKVLSGDLTSQRLSEAIDTFIADNMDEVRAEIARDVVGKAA